jgi:tetratricopeptide (TPR) repeat protein
MKITTLKHLQFQKIISIVSFLLISNLLISQSVIFNSAKKNFEEGKLDESKKMFNLIGKSTSEYAEAKFYLGKIYYAEKKLDDAIQSFEDAIKANGKNAEYYFYLGNVKGEKAMHANIIQQAILAKEIMNAWQTGEKIDSMHLGIQLGLLNFYIMAPSVMGGGIDKAYKTADKIIRINYADGCQAKGFVYDRDKKTDLAEKMYKEAIKSNPKELRYSYSLGIFYLRHNFKEKSLEFWTSLANNYPDEARPFLELGNLYSSDPKTHEKAIVNLNRFLQLTKKDDNYGKSRANFCLGNISKAKGDKVNAKKYYEITLSFNPRSKEAKDALEEINQ